MLSITTMQSLTRNKLNQARMTRMKELMKSTHPSQNRILNESNQRRLLSNNNTGSTAYPSGSVKHPTHIVNLTSPLNKFDSSSRSIPLQHRQLPDLPNRRPTQIMIFLTIGIIWITFIQFSKNSEKFNSSIIKEILFELRNNLEIKNFLGDLLLEEQEGENENFIKPLKDSYFSQVWVDGNINLMQGSVDVAFRVTGSKHSGKVYFTSVRRDRESEFEIIRWKLIRDDGEVIDLLKGKNGTSKILKVDDKQDSIKIRSIIINDDNSSLQLHSPNSSSFSSSDKSN